MGIAGRDKWAVGDSQQLASARADRYLLYSPCVEGNEPGYCLGQFNNQIHLLYHALAVARALQRTLVLPPLMWMEAQQAAEQKWFPASHFLDICAMRRRQPVIELQSFVQLVANMSGGALSYFIYPPYVLPPGRCRVGQG